MSTRTEKLGLLKPELSDPANITLTNENWDKIDNEFAKGLYSPFNKPTPTEIGAVSNTVEDISDSFVTNPCNEATTLEARVFKQGNVISGTVALEFQDNFVPGDGRILFYIPQEYKPKAKAVIPSCAGQEVSKAYDNLTCMVSPQGNTSVVYCASNNPNSLDALYISFNYICE